MTRLTKLSSITNTCMYIHRNKDKYINRLTKETLP